MTSSGTVTGIGQFSLYYQYAYGSATISPIDCSSSLLDNVHVRYVRCTISVTM